MKEDWTLLSKYNSTHTVLYWSYRSVQYKMYFWTSAAIAVHIVRCQYISSSMPEMDRRPLPGYGCARNFDRKQASSLNTHIWVISETICLPFSMSFENYLLSFNEKVRVSRVGRNIDEQTQRVEERDDSDGGRCCAAETLKWEYSPTLRGMYVGTGCAFNFWITDLMNSIK